MGDTGAPHNLPFPELGDSPDVPRDVKALADKTHAELSRVEGKADGNAQDIDSNAQDIATNAQDLADLTATLDGGDAGQVLTKSTNADGDYMWADSQGGGGGGTLLKLFSAGTGGGGG